MPSDLAVRRNERADHKRARGTKQASPLNATTALNLLIEIEYQ